MAASFKEEKNISASLWHEVCKDEEERCDAHIVQIEHTLDIHVCIP